MWVVMMVAMMLPSLVPMLWRYRQAVGRTGDTPLGRLTALVGMGYFFVWTDDLLFAICYLLFIVRRNARLRQSRFACAGSSTFFKRTLPPYGQQRGRRIQPLARPGGHALA
jgi:predicted metal-binding membrane protein